MEKLDVAIIVVTYNGMPWLDACLRSCTNHPVIVIDNASTDETVSFIETHYPNVILLKQTVNLGFGQANNIGIRYALNHGADHVFLLNQDAYLVDSVLDKLITFQKEHPEYGILSPIHITGDKQKLDKNFSNYMLREYTGGFYSDFVLKNDIAPVYQVPFVNAAAWLISKKCLETVGGFDPLFFHYGEDDNYCQRVLFHGFKIGVLPKTYIIHDRTDRPSSKVLPWTEFYFELQVRRYKLNFSNVNDDHALDLFYKELKRLRLSFIKVLLLLKIDTFKGLIKQYKMLQGLEDVITASYTRNKIKDSHYLDL